MKRRIALILALLMALTAVTATAGETAQSGYTSLVVANPTPMRGEFLTEMWGNATSDIDVRDLLHGYNLVYWDVERGLFTVDPSVVSGVAAMENEAGDHTYVLVLSNDLLWSDGSRITAWDYAFSFLFSISPVLEQIGAAPLRREQIAGYRRFMEEGGTLSGVRVLADDTLSVTLNHEYLPFFYEMGLLYCNPYPISVIAPGVEVRDDGQGVYLANMDPAVTEPLFNADVLRTTILDKETGYQSHPAVSSGPYTITSWDGTTAEFELNPYYKGNHRGEKPSINHLTYTLAVNDTMISELAEGKIDLLNKVTRTDTINGGMALMLQGGYAMSNYPRIGLSFISFATERPTVSSEAVRQAIAYCFDRNAALQDYTGPFGIRADGYYGLGQWMYGMVSGTLVPPIAAPEDETDTEAQQKYEAQLAAFEGLSLERLNPYELNTALAARLLEGDGWKLNADGLREKDGVVLDLHMIYPEGNNANETLQVNLVENLEKVGIRLTMEAVPMNELLGRWYQQQGRSYDMVYHASNFDIIFDPSVHFSPDGAWAYTNLVDEELYNAAVAMRKTEPGDVLTYMQHWLEFQERFNTILPMIPVYTNIYFDFYRDDLHNYYIDENVTWGQAIVASYLAEEAEAAEEEEADAEDVMIIDD